MIEVRNLSRSYGDLKAVSGVSFDIDHGEIVGLLGHNGAGKTTIMKMLTGYLEPSGGTIRIDGLDIAEHRREVQRRVGYLPENCPLYPEQTVLDALEYQAVLHALPSDARPAAIRRAVERTALEAKASAQVATLSRGYRQRLGVALAILHSPKILILDEPTNGLDPTQIQHMRELIQELARDATVIVSTHILQEVEAVCARVLIMSGGRLALDSQLAAVGRSPRLLVTLDRTAVEARPMLGALPGVSGVTLLDSDAQRHRFALTVADAGAAAPAVARAVGAQGWDLFALEPERRDLEALFRAVSDSAALTGTAAPTEAVHV
ncbi:ABC transporter ATP-binding protein [Candidatus Thiodictyon syntrophicum]|jgi:ABC-2 type transport system ATP-binding protein|uniref:Multidrug ABC transporter ATP-binding protein n=1 Tax=Candidatus Thiodictyon syntrophicum TaxID=1166950 RepID=A0A2K8U5B7_9GAMM|nr:ABC transporter ATP-binding protein [Candidatus Thiodictyon syntrophicum]AUB80231.1 multidrug ABC transporter ATP-binding protein [Candidatus Thiodictyon syntrophicum]